MNTASRWLLVLGLVSAFVGLSGVSAPSAKAQDVQITGPLAGAPAVRKMRVFRDGRFQLQPTMGFTLQDEFARTMFAGVQLGYHFTDWLGVGGFFNYGALSIDTGLTDQVATRGQTTERNQLSLPNNKKFPDQIGRLKVEALTENLRRIRPNLAVEAVATRIDAGNCQALFADCDLIGALGREQRGRSRLLDPVE